MRSFLANAQQRSEDAARVHLGRISQRAKETCDAIDAESRDGTAKLKRGERIRGGWLPATVMEVASGGEMKVQLTRIMSEIGKYLRDAAESDAMVH